MGERRSHSAFFSPSEALAALSAANFFFTNLINSLIIKDDIFVVECRLVFNYRKGRWTLSLIGESEISMKRKECG